jgi:hypothetical protein
MILFILTSLFGSKADRTRGASSVRARQFPERTHQSHCPKDLLDLLLSLPPPFEVLPSGVPAFGQLPALLDGDDAASSKASLVTPAGHVVSRPEEKNGGSGKADVIPELSRRDGEVNDRIPRLHGVASHPKHEDFPAVGAKGGGFGVQAQQR